MHSRIIAATFLAFFAFGSCAQTAQAADQSAAEAPQATPTPFETAQSLAARGRLDKAMPILDGLAAQSPEPAGVERLRGMILYQKDQFPDAFKAFSKAAEQDPQDRESIEMQGLSFIARDIPRKHCPILKRRMQRWFARMWIRSMYLACATPT